MGRGFVLDTYRGEESDKDYVKIGKERTVIRSPPAVLLMIVI